MTNIEINVKRAAFSLGALFAILHFVGVLLIAGTGGGIVDFWMNTHHVQMAHSYSPLNIVYLVIGTITAGISGAIIGALFAAIWNYFKE